jgi:hypothetical protein
MRPIFTVHAGEFLVGEHIEQNFKGKSKKNIWVPTKDTGVDLLVTNQENKKAISLQVKFSKDFIPMMKLPSSIQKELRVCTWFTLDREKMKRSVADLWVFVLAGFANRTYDYVVIKPTELIKRLDALDANSKKFQIYIWVTEHERCWLTRGLSKDDHDDISKNAFASSVRDLTRYLNNWSLIGSL